MSHLGWRLAGGGASESKSGQGGGFDLAEEPLGITSGAEAVK